MNNILFNLFFSFLLFFMVNWFGRSSTKFGYYQLSFNESEEKPIFNMLYRSFTPVIFILILSIILNQLNLFYLTKNIYLTVMFYFLIRFIFIFLIERSKITNWAKHILIALISILLAYVVYKNFIEKRYFPLPTEQEITTALWFAIIGYVYKVINNISMLSSNDSRKINYIKHMHNHFSCKYGSVIDEAIGIGLEEMFVEKQKALIYSILIYENFNRHRLHRLIERLFFWTGKIKTSGIMQVTSETYLSDEDSIKKGANILIGKYNQVYEKEYSNTQNKYHFFYTARRESIKHYNPDQSYIDEVESIHTLLEDIYPKSSDIYGCEGE
ncbi:hypothetical protein [Neisseria animaloris]|uniref:hypothetical protein n=1 Tax=Neisseria animaloris TaxID=326522 RepID=UPI001F277BBF|nr:hypothetical protein [Neisseria animaloris]